MEAAITPLDLCAPSILCPRVQSPSTPSMHFQFIFELWWEKDENRPKESGIGPHLLKYGPNPASFLFR